MTTLEQHSRESDSAALEFDLDLTFDHEIRQGVRELLAAEDNAVVNDAVLCTDELVTNARRHGDPPRSCRIFRRSGPDRLRIEVEDTGAATPRVRASDDHGGRGLLLLDRLALTWGVLTGPEFKTVWAELALSPSAVPTSA
ncbi:ATP-binding protein [Nocardia sp. NPDC048505]|uniref:ATP-binding protein n=1 Tax=unclassified Nocardia TaxID=2637762 RepID=UPI0033C2CB1D